MPPPPPPHTHARTHARARAHTHTHTRAHTHAHTHTHTHTLTRAHARTLLFKSRFYSLIKETTPKLCRLCSCPNKQRSFGPFMCFDFCCCTCVAYFERELTPLFVDSARVLWALFCFRLRMKTIHPELFTSRTIPAPFCLSHYHGCMVQTECAPRRQQFQVSLAT